MFLIYLSFKKDKAKGSENAVFWDIYFEKYSKLFFKYTFDGIQLSSFRGETLNFGKCLHRD
jgi:hypothetical protein